MNKNNSLMNLLLPNPQTTISSTIDIVSPSSGDSASPSSNTGEEDKIPVKRKRLTQACDACRKKKVKCSGEKPSCKNCLRLGIPCAYLPSTKKRGPRVGLVESLEKRLQQMEKLLQPLKAQGLVDEIDDNIPISDPVPKRPRLNPTPPKTNFTSDTNGIQSFNNEKLSDASAIQPSTNPSFLDAKLYTDPSLTPFFKPQTSSPTPNMDTTNNNSSNIFQTYQPDFISVQKQTQSPPHPSTMQSIPPPTTHPPSENSINNDREPNNEKRSNFDDVVLFIGNSSGITYRQGSFIYCKSLQHGITPPIMLKNVQNRLPPTELVVHLASCFFRNGNKQMPVFHETTIMRRLQEDKVSPFLAFALCAAGARYSERPGIVDTNNPLFLAGEHYIEIAESMLIEAFDTPSVETCQGILLLAVHSYGAGRGPRAWMYIGIAFRMAQELGLYKEFRGAANGSSKNKLDTESAFIEREVRRRTLWGIFLVDRFSATALGRPTIFDEADIEISLPIPDHDWDTQHPVCSDVENGQLIKTHKRGGRLTLSNRGLFATLVSVSTLLGRVANYVNRAEHDSLEPWKPNSDFNILLKEAEDWYRSLSPQMRWSEEQLKKHLQFNVGGAYASVHLVYYAAVVGLHRPNTQLKGELTPEELEFSRASQEKCTEYARKVTEITEVLLGTGCCRACSLTIYPIFFTATIHARDCFRGDGALSKSAQKCLAIHCNFLYGMQTYWAMAKKFLESLFDMYNRGGNINPAEIVPCGRSSETQITVPAGLDIFQPWNSSATPKQTAKNLDKRGDTVFGLNSSFAETNLGMQYFLPSEVWSLPGMNNSWSSFLKSPSLPITPRTLLLLSKKDFNEGGDDEIIGDDYFSQDMTFYNSPLNNPFTFNNVFQETSVDQQNSISDYVSIPERLYRVPNTGPKYLTQLD